MKRFVICTLAAGLVALTGCVGPMGPMGGVGGQIWTDVSGPVAATSHPTSPATKSGTATSQGILGFAWGNSSINAAASSAGITQISHVDYNTQMILGIWAKTTVIVYGN